MLNSRNLGWMSCERFDVQSNHSINSTSALASRHMTSCHSSGKEAGCSYKVNLRKDSGSWNINSWRLAENLVKCRKLDSILASNIFEGKTSNTTVNLHLFNKVVEKSRPCKLWVSKTSWFLVWTENKMATDFLVQWVYSW